VDGGWTSLRLTEQRTRCLEQEREAHRHEESWHWQLSNGA
jgi:hypothetical protein